MQQPALNIENEAELMLYLRAADLLDAAERPRFEVLRGGVSNRAVLVSREPKYGASWVVKQALPKLRVQADWQCDPARIQVEAAGLRWLGRLLPDGSVPAFVREDQQHHLLMMQAIEQPHENWKTQLLSGKVEPSYFEAFGQLLARLHSRSADWRAGLSAEFANQSFFESLRLEPYYLYPANQLPEAAVFLRNLVDSTRQRKLTLVHGDYSPKNVLVRNNRLVLLDHEVLHWGDPAFDIGFSMAHFLSKANHLSTHRDQFAEAAHRYWNCYSEAAGDASWRDGLDRYAVLHTVACMLARVAGKSPLEYLSPHDRSLQQQVVCDLIAKMPAGMSDLINDFVTAITFGPRGGPRS